MRDKIKDILLASIQVKEEIMRNDIPKIIDIGGVGKEHGLILSQYELILSLCLV